MDKLVFINKVQEARVEWQSLLAEVDKSRMTDPDLPGGWSVKDVIAHITWYEREMIGMLKAMALEGSDLWQLPQDKRNVPIYEENKDRPLEEVLSEAEQVYDQLFEAIASLSEDELSDPSHFRDMPSEWIPWDVMAGNTYDHYYQHIPDIQAWLEESKEST
ncbi:MAG: DinB family protein [Candidatus Hodarchaeota archaeon]